MVLTCRFSRRACTLLDWLSNFLFCSLISFSCSFKEHFGQSAMHDQCLQSLVAGFFSELTSVSPNNQLQDYYYNYVRAPSCGGYDEMYNSTRISIRSQVFKTQIPIYRVANYNQSIQDTDSELVCEHFLPSSSCCRSAPWWCRSCSWAVCFPCFSLGQDPAACSPLAGVSGETHT